MVAGPTSHRVLNRVPNSGEVSLFRSHKIDEQIPNCL